MEENVITVTCMAIIALLFFVWLGAAVTFVPLAIPFFYIV